MADARKCGNPKCGNNAVPWEVCYVCQAQQYCSPECTSEDFPIHLQICRPKQLMPARIPPGNAHLLIDYRTYSTDKFTGHDDKDTTYKLIIETCRCLDEDIRRVKGEKVDEDCLWILGFKFAFLEGFIDKAQIGDRLPDWWNAESHAECLAECLDVARTMYFWDDGRADLVTWEVSESNPYGGRELRKRMRILAGKIVKRDILGELGLRANVGR